MTFLDSVYIKWALAEGTKEGREQEAEATAELTFLVRAIEARPLRHWCS